MPHPPATVSHYCHELQQGNLSATELMQQCLAAAKQWQHLNAFSVLDEERALARAGEVERQIRAGHTSAIAGVPIALKDLFCVKDMPLTCASRILEGYRAPYDSQVATCIHDALSPIIGKTNMDEFAMGSSGEHSCFGATLNPWSSDRVPGGSSSGSAAAVAAGIVPIALATDTGGSTRQPAAYCGITGIKPSYGTISRYGMSTFASSFDQCGVMARTAADCAHVLALLMREDARDATCVPLQERTGARPCDLDRPSIAGRKIAIPREYFSTDAGLDPQIAQTVEDAIAQLEKEGAHCTSITLSDVAQLKGFIATYYVLTSAECASNLSRYDGIRYGPRRDADSLLELYEQNRTVGFGAEVKRRILIGNYVLSYGYYDAYYRYAMRVRKKLQSLFDAIFTEYDFILSPTAPSVAFRLGAYESTPEQMYLNDIYTIPSNLAGLPAISVPCGFVNNEGTSLPVGLQLVARRFDEASLLEIAHRYQQITDWHTYTPPAPQ